MIVDAFQYANSYFSFAARLMFFKKFTIDRSYTCGGLYDNYFKMLFV